MKISLNTAQYFSNIDFKAIGHEKLVEKIGAQLGEVEGTVDWAPKYEGIVIVRVVSCVDHPNADKLHVCMIDDGGAIKDVERDANGHVQVVCGAPNVREGLVVAWIPPGATVPTTYGTSEPFVLQAKELRGVISNGMLASAAELGLSDNHEGLLEIDESDVGREVTPGEAFVTIYGLDDFIIDVENKMFTHRPDCFGILGVSREIAGITNQAFVSPKWYSEQPQFNPASGLDVRVSVEISELVPRFMAVAFKDIAIKASPNWLQAALTRIGIRPINNIVDITNWVMYITGQPLHAYDYDKVAKRTSGDGAEIIVRQPKPGETITLLNGKTIEPRAEAIMIASSTELIGVGGVMGGGDTEVDENTTAIILEAASFDMYSIRRTSMAHGLFTDAVTRFNKGQSPWQNDRVIAYAMELVQQLASGSQASDVLDIRSELAENPTLQIKASFINERLGLFLSAGEMATLLKNVEFTVESDAETLTVKAPFWRTDISIPEDIVEEVGRLYGFDHLPLILPSRTTDPVPRDQMLTLKSRIRHILKAAGANEALTYSFVHGDLLKKTGQDTKSTFTLSNALSPGLQHYRIDIISSLLEKIHPNLKAGFEEFALFELGKTHDATMIDEDGVPIEFERLAFVYAANSKISQKDDGAAYFKAVSFIKFLFSQLHVTAELRQTDSVNLPFEHTRSASITLADGTTIGTIGEFTTKAIQNLKLPKRSAGFELDTMALLNALTNTSQYQALPKYPKVSQDISLRIPDGTSYAIVVETLTNALEANKPEQTQVTVEPIDIYRNQDTNVKHMSFRVTVANYVRTMKTDEVSDLMSTVAAQLQQQIGAERI